MRNDSINEDKSEQRGCIIKILPLAVIVIIIFVILWATGLIRFESTPETMEQEDSADRKSTRLNSSHT